MIYDVPLPWPRADANKYSRGKLVLVAGSDRYPGAAVLAARASQRMGAGYTEVVTSADAVDVVRLSSPSLVVRPLETWDVSELPAFSEAKPCAVCIGPGYSPDDVRQAALVASVLESARCPVLVDGGGLAGLISEAARQVLAVRSAQGHATLITPHGGEAARLAGPLGIDAGDQERLAVELSAALGCAVVLKGPNTVIADGARTFLMTRGSAALAKAGTGDVLAGMVAALLAQGMDPFSAGVLGAEVHAEAGNAAAALHTAISVIAEDVVDAIGQVLGIGEGEGRA